jgi:predicted CopG family antitoxin
MTIHIQVDDNVHKKLTELGHKGEKYSDIIMRLINDIEKRTK